MGRRDGRHLAVAIGACTLASILVISGEQPDAAFATGVEGRSDPPPIATSTPVGGASPWRAGASHPPAAGGHSDSLPVVIPKPAAPLPSGIATWYDDGPGLYGAVGSFQWGDRPYTAQVCRAGRCVKVRIRDYCAACARGDVLIDLSPAAFTRLGLPLTRGVMSVTVDGLR